MSKVSRDRPGDDERSSGVSRRRVEALAERLERGAQALAALAGELTEEGWQRTVPRDGRAVGTVVHHVASMYPLEIELARTLARGEPIVGVTMDDVHAMNALHARENASVGRDDALELLRHNSAWAAAAIRELHDDELDRAASVSMYGGAPLTCQFFLEDHAVRHSWHHLSAIRKAVKA